MKYVKIEEGEGNLVHGDQKSPRNGDVILCLDAAKWRRMIKIFKVMKTPTMV